jgi:hypothetical protein
MSEFIAIVTLAILVESLAEVVKAGIAPAVLPKWAWLIITSALGVALCLIFGVEIFSVLGFVGGTAAAVIAAQVITGIAVGAGSSFMHNLIGKLTDVKKE